MLLSTRVTRPAPDSPRVRAAPPALAGPVRARHLPLPVLAGGEDRPDTGLAHVLDRMVGQPVQIALAGGLTLQGVLAAAAGDTLVLAGAGPVTYVNARDVVGIASASRVPAAAGGAVMTTARAASQPEPGEPRPSEPTPAEAGSEARPPAHPGETAPTAAGSRRPAVLFTQPTSFSQTHRTGPQTARAAVRPPCPRSVRWHCVAIVR